MRIPQSWEQTWLSIIDVIAQRSKDPNTQVGAALISPDNRIVHLGYNGFPFDISDPEERLQRPTKYKYVVHAEANAILNSKTDLHGWTLYVTIPPCAARAKLIIQSGIKRVIYQNAPNASSMLDYKFSQDLLNEAGIELIQGV